jgi:hypothetical protein
MKKDQIMKINIEGKEYEIDINRAKELGLCKETHKKITDFSAGDVFESKSGTRILIIETSYSNTKYNIAGRNGLYLYSNFNETPFNREQMLEYLNGEQMLEYLNDDRKYKFIKNINSDIDALINS